MGSQAGLCRGSVLSLGLLWALVGLQVGAADDRPGATTRPKAVEVRLVDNGRAVWPVVVSPQAAERVKQAAATLATYLGKIGNCEVVVEASVGDQGLVVGLASEFTNLPLTKKWDLADPTRAEDYVIKSHERGAYLLGATPLAVEHAVWDLLWRLGYRQYFPGENWEIIPQRKTLALAIDVDEHPSYYSRRIWYGYGPWDYAAKPYAEWCAKNRATSGIELSTGHAYDGIIHRNKAAFDAHPEYYGLVGGVRKSSKICISNPEVRALVVADARAQFEKDAGKQSVSVDPSDGLGWCECEKCQALGSVSDRALTLANTVAAAVNQQKPGRYVGMYAYSGHSPPPGIKVHPQVIISVATAFIQGGYSVDQLMTGWQKQGATLGVREYYSVHTWDRDLPGKSRGSNTEYLARTIPHFHKLGARFLSSESSDNWGPNGLGYFLASRMLWDVREAERVPALIDDFLTNCFGPAKVEMAEFYRLIDGQQRSLLSDDLVGRMYRLLEKSREKTTDAATHRRLDDLVLYTRYVELWLKYSTAAGAERQAAFEQVIRHGYRMRKTMLIHAKALYRDVDSRDKSVSIPDDARWQVAEGKNPWKHGTPYSQGEVETILKEGVANNKLLDFRAVSFSDQLVPATKLQLPEVPQGSMGIYLRGTRSHYTWVEKEPFEFALKVKGGIIYRSRGDVKLGLYPIAEPEGKAVAEASVPPDQQEHAVVLKGTLAGLNRLDVSDKGAGTLVTWNDGVPMTVISSPDDPAAFHGRWNLYFYVPKGTTVIGGFADGPGTLVDPHGKTAYTFSNKPHYFSVPVAAEEAGKLWKFQHSAGHRYLMTVPPCLARSASELLLPREVVERDAAK